MSRPTKSNYMFLYDNCIQEINNLLKIKNTILVFKNTSFNDKVYIITNKFT